MRPTSNSFAGPIAPWMPICNVSPKNSCRWSYSGPAPIDDFGSNFLRNFSAKLRPAPDATDDSNSRCIKAQLVASPALCASCNTGAKRGENIQGRWGKFRARQRTSIHTRPASVPCVARFTRPSRRCLNES